MTVHVAVDWKNSSSRGLNEVYSNLKKVTQIMNIQSNVGSLANVKTIAFYVLHRSYITKACQLS